MQQAGINYRFQFAEHPIHKAAKDPDLERAFDEVARRAFGLRVTIDRYAGASVPLLVGERPAFEHLEGVPTQEYLDALARIPQLDAQGDGVKSFLGLMIHLVAGAQQVLLIDEPEAFLHPPQARTLGRMLAERSSDRQVFIATHSADILQGVLEAEQPVTIVRLRREGDINHAAVLEDAAVRTLWQDPLLRYSDILDGLFHDAVILCEGDSDCRYYSAVRDYLFPATEKERRPELLFTHCGGKHRLHTAIQALRAVQVPMLTVGDFDLLREKDVLRRVYEAAGGEWTTLERDHAVMSSALGTNATLDKATVSAGLNDRLATAGSKEVAGKLGPGRGGDW